MSGDRLRPLHLSDIFDEGFDLYKQNLPFLLLVTALTFVPATLVIDGVAYNMLHNVFGAMGSITGTEGIPDPARLAGWLNENSGFATLLVLVVIAVNAFGFVTLALTTSSRYLGAQTTLGSVYGTAFRRIVPLIVTALLYAAAMGASVLVCLVPSAIVGTLLVLTGHTFGIERKSYFSAMRRSCGLVNGGAWRVFLGLALLSVVYWILSIGLSLPFEYLLGLVLNLVRGDEPNVMGALANMSQREMLVQQIGDAFAELLITPFIVSVLTVLYYDLRVRKEAFDIDTLANDLGYPPLSQLSGYLPAMPFPGHSMTRRVMRNKR